MSYHNGSVWPHDNALIAAGLARYGYRAEAAQIVRGLFEARPIRPQAAAGAVLRLPARAEPRAHLYPVACSPQAWAAAATLSLLRSCLGIGFDPETDFVTFDQPFLRNSSTR